MNTGNEPPKASFWGEKYDSWKEYKFFDEYAFKFMFGLILNEIENNFTPIVPDAQKSLLNIVAKSFEDIYQLSLIGKSEHFFEKRQKIRALMEKGFLLKNLELNHN